MKIAHEEIYDVLLNRKGYILVKGFNDRLGIYSTRTNRVVVSVESVYFNEEVVHIFQRLTNTISVFDTKFF